MRRRPLGWIAWIRVGKEAMADNGHWAKTEARERELNGSMHGSSKSVAVVQRELAPASTVFGAGLVPAVVRDGGPSRFRLRSQMPIQVRDRAGHPDGPRPPGG